MRKLIASIFASLDGVMRVQGGPEKDPTENFTPGARLAALSAGLVLLTSIAAGTGLAREQTERSAIRETSSSQTGHYASVNGLKMYYEVHGSGRPLLLLHGAFMTIEGFGPLLPALAGNHQVIAVELEGHGRTADLDRPLTMAQMAEDVASLLDQLKIKEADVMGYSMGGIVAIRLAIRRPDLVRKLLIISSANSLDGLYPVLVESIRGMTPTGSPAEKAYADIAPDKAHWPVFFEKMKRCMTEFKGWPDSDLQSIKAPVLLVLGDTDMIRPEYAVNMFRLLGGCKSDGGMGGLPKSRLAILPGTTHFTILYNLDLLLPVISPFLDSIAPKR